MFINDRWGTGCTLSQFSDYINLSGAVDLLEGREGWLTIWRHGPMKFPKAKCKVLQMGCSNSQCLYRLGDDQSPAKGDCKSAKGLGLLVGWKIVHGLATWAWSRKATAFWAATKAAWRASQGSWFCRSTPCWWPHLECYIQPWGQQYRKLMASVSVAPEECHKNNQMAGASLLWRQPERAKVVSPAEEKALRRPFCIL